MKSSVSVAAAVAIFAGLSGLAAAQDTAVLARVNGLDITRADVDEVIARLGPQAQQAPLELALDQIVVEPDGLAFVRLELDVGEALEAVHAGAPARHRRIPVGAQQTVGDNQTTGSERDASKDAQEGPVHLTTSQRAIIA